MNDNSLMPWGEHKGKKLGDIPAGYLLWLFGQPWIVEHRELYAYLKENEKCLLEESSEEDRQLGHVDGEDDDTFEGYMRQRL